MKHGGIIFLLILLVGAGIAALFIVEKPQPPLDSTFAPAFQLLGRTTKTFDRALSKTMPISDLDEKAYGEAIILRYRDRGDLESKDCLYLNDLMQQISRFAKKPFHYKVFIMHMKEPNACALPGGVILVADGLLSTMKTEAEITSILAHEMGHIERSHCYDAVRFKLAARKIGSEPLGSLADFAVSLMLRHSFSKTQEDEADEYAYELILNTAYDPSAPGESFQQLIEYKKKSSAVMGDDHSNIIRDYFLTHPPLTLRYEKFSGMAKQWWIRHQEERRYRGMENLRKRTCFDKKKFDNEWVTANNKRRNIGKS